MGQYEQLIHDLRTTFKSGKTRSLAWRVAQLKGIVNLLQENADKISEVLYKDLHKHQMESHLLEIDLCIGETIDTINSLSAWMKPTNVKKDTMFMMDTAYIRPEPFGVALLIGAWNYPIQLAILPLVGAIAAGNCAVLKPSELSEATAKFLEEFIPKYLDTDCIKVVNGGVPETTDLLAERFDIILYTGNSTVGRIIMAAAAKNLTPVLLELGGKSPVYIDKGVDLYTVARRICWGKFVNAGQTCIAPDYIMCPKEIQDEFIKNVEISIEEFFGKDPKKSESFGRIVNARHVQRIQKLKKGATMALEGEDDEADKYIAPTVCRDVKLTDLIMQEEIFGPLMPIVPVADHSEALQIINDQEKPLALYLFSKNKDLITDFREKTSSGALLVNDTIVHGGISTLPFGGVGNSGMGAYHGKFSFNAFSHHKAVLEKSLALESMQSIRYPPYTEKKLGWITWIMQKKIKKSGFFSFMPFMVLGTVLAVFIKTVGVTAQSLPWSSSDVTKMSTSNRM